MIRANLTTLDTEALQNEESILRIQHEATKSAHGAVLSMTKVSTLQTRSRDELHAYIKSVSSYYFGSMTGFHKMILKYYLEEQPWKRPGWVWVTPKSTYSYAGGISMLNHGWCQYNITAPMDIMKDVRRTHQKIKSGQPKVSLAAFLHTMLIWGIANYFPPCKGVKHAGPDVDSISRRVLN
jgi:hypothetical protein